MRWEIVGHVGTETVPATWRPWIQRTLVPISAQYSRHGFKSSANASKEEWELRKALWPAIETNETKAIDHAAMAAGADLVRVCGAGGGGVMAAVCEPEVRGRVCRAIELGGGKLLEAIPCETGLTVQLEA
jgi:galactokinase/mevalonate kinase-like predicted kinase